MSKQNRVTTFEAGHWTLGARTVIGVAEFEAVTHQMIRVYTPTTSVGQLYRQARKGFNIEGGDLIDASIDEIIDIELTEEERSAIWSKPEDATTEDLRRYCRWNDRNGSYFGAPRETLLEILNGWKAEDGEGMSHGPVTVVPSVSWSFSKELPESKYPLQRVISIASDGAVIAHVNCSFGTGPQNAALIAASPLLLMELRKSLEALENLAAYLVKHQDALPPVSLTGTQLQIERNRAAIEKAVRS